MIVILVQKKVKLVMFFNKSSQYERYIYIVVFVSTYIFRAWKHQDAAKGVIFGKILDI